MKPYFVLGKNISCQNEVIEKIVKYRFIEQNKIRVCHFHGEMEPSVIKLNYSSDEWGIEPNDFRRNHSLLMFILVHLTQEEKDAKSLW
jgi:hypothetical protein